MRSGLYQFISSLLLCILILGIAGQAAEDSSGTVLKIGTPNVVKSASILGDSNMGVFAHLSNPTLMKMTEDGELAGLTARSSEVSADGKIWKFTPSTIWTLSPWPWRKATLIPPEVMI